MKVVSDTSPLISIAVIDRLELLEKLFPTIIVPQAVFLEIKKGSEKAESAKILHFIENRVYSPKDAGSVQVKLGKGEIEAISLCLEVEADLLIIDDKKARNAAESFGIKCIGTLGLLTLAKKRGLIREFRKYFLQLIEKQRYFSIGLLNEILRLNREYPIV
ncbi:MAG: DUF3368 domain-containing protein [Candidatus Aminicenantes bacterium]|nr:DUF3368 domain-containing protein [Candidatus Aminicenantes bacterium]